MCTHSPAQTLLATRGAQSSRASRGRLPGTAPDLSDRPGATSSTDASARRPPSGSVGRRVAAGARNHWRGRTPHVARATVWWRTHQIVHRRSVLAAVGRWHGSIKEWQHGAGDGFVFLALGAAATIGGVLRGHLVFTERMNRARLVAERKRDRARNRIGRL